VCAKTDLGGIALVGMLTAIYLWGIKFFPSTRARLHIVALLGGIGIGVVAVVLSFESSWHMSHNFEWSDRTVLQNVAFVIELLFPIVAILLAGSDLLRRRAQFSLSAAIFPIVTAIIWGVANLCETSAAQHLYATNCSFAAAALMNCYALWLGVDILARGIHSNSVARAIFGLLLIAALAISRFFDSELSFVTRGLGFIVVGAGFLVGNILLFKRRSSAAA